MLLSNIALIFTTVHELKQNIYCVMLFLHSLMQNVLQSKYVLLFAVFIGYCDVGLKWPKFSMI